MTFQQAENEVKALLPLANLVVLEYTRDIWQNGNRDNAIIPRCTIRFMDEKHHAESFDGMSWEQTINRLKIYLIPTGEPGNDEAPDEPAQAKEGA